MLSLSFALLWKIAAVLLIAVALIDLLTISDDRRVRMLRRQGMTQQAIAERLGITRYTVRKALASS